MIDQTQSISDAKLKANRENAQHSTGPRTEAGKKRSSLNAWRTGLTGHLQCLPAEELAVLRKLTDEVIAEYKPAGPTERFLAVSCAENMYRISRCRALENGIFANGFMDRIGGIDVGDPEVESSLAAAQTFEAQAHRLSLLSVYEGRIRRTLDRDLAALKAAQAECKAAHKRAVKQASNFIKHARSKGERYSPGRDFEPAES